jgi:organic hydroperoxide reductase OsmC/OhrA
MKPLPHSYEIALSGGPAGYATLSTEGVPALSSAPPKEFDGPGDAWSPEHLLLASVLACFIFTFRAVARGSISTSCRLTSPAAAPSTARMG